MPGFVRVEGQRIVDPDGRPLLLRTIGLGNWLLPEGYMWKLGAEGDRPRKIERLVEQLVGPGEAARFWSAFRDAFCTEADVRRMKEMGFNSVRLAMNGRLFMDEETGELIPSGFVYVDRLVKWCKRHALYVIRDLHGAPGGQTGRNIDDSRRDLPELFMDDRFAERAVRLWRAIAARYAADPTIIAYDLLNEPLPSEVSEHNPKLFRLYRTMMGAIREVDPHHMITLEGAHWSNDWSIFTSHPGPGVILQFHQYWEAPTAESIRPYLDKRAELDLPIWCGETGENENDWYKNELQLFEDHDIGWCFWPWKKLASTNNPYAIRKPPGWEKIRDFSDGGARPDPAEAKDILGAYIENLPLERCLCNEPVLEAIFRRQNV
jgi:aryl-phospho-beta-D-glucosidase BglC (GH1 family)